MRLGGVLSAVVFLASSQGLPAADEVSDVPEGTSENTPATVLTNPIREISGPKRSIAVGTFDAVGAFTAYYGNWDIGGGLGAMLTSALVESGRFIVVERANLSEILTEQQLSAEGLSSSSTAPQAGNLAGAQLIIFGSVTAFDMRDAGGGFSIGVSKSVWKGGVGRQKSEGVVTLDFRLVDSSSGEVLKTHTVTEEVEAKGWDMSVGYEGISLGDNKFMQTPLGQASRGAVTKAVEQIAKDVSDRPWRGLVVLHEDGQLYINAGTRAGIEAQDRFYVERVVRKLTDPQTEAVLSIKTKRLGMVTISDVDDAIAFGVYQPESADPPQRGDLVEYAR